VKPLFGHPPKLDRLAMRWIFDAVMQKKPLWTRLAQLGITCQKPLIALERDEALVQQWLTKEYPQIKVLAQKKQAELHFGDSAHIRSDHHAGRTWGRLAETPVVQATGARYGMSLISAVTARGHTSFVIKEKASTPMSSSSFSNG
jgi:hypothetical protein